MDAITGVQASLARKAKEASTHRFGDLWPLICREEWITYAVNHVLTNSGARTAGVDGVTRAALKDDDAQRKFVLALQAELKAKVYQPEPTRRVYIPKPSGKMRPLGIPTIKDRTVQMLLKMVMEPIWESDFLDCSSGFRIGRRTMDCIWTVYQLTYPKSRMYWAVEGDIRGCFDNIHHGILMDQIGKRIQDPRILKLLEQFLTAGVMEKQLFQRTEAGTPQGGIVSPLLANIYLHQLDRYWWENHGDLTWAERRGRRQHHQGNNHLIRYADDFLILTNGPRAEAERLKVEFGAYLRDDLKLELSPEKTLISHINDGYNFLGFQIKRFVDPKEGEKPVVLVFPSEEGQKRFKDKVRKLTAADRQADPLDTMKAYNRLATGWANYYRFVNSKETFVQLDHWTFNRLLFWFGGHHRTGPRRAWEMYVKQQTGHREGATRLNLAVKDEQGGLLFRKNMADLEVRRYTGRKRGNPYLDGEVTTISEPELPDLPHLWVTGVSGDTAEWRKVRWQKLAEVEYRCERCGSAENLDVHHTKAAKGRERTRLHHPPEWLEVLCETCHLELHGTNE